MFPEEVTAVNFCGGRGTIWENMKMKQNPEFPKRYSGHGALFLSLMLAAGLFANSAAGEAGAKSPKQPVSSVLILTGAGMVSSSLESPTKEKVFLAAVKVCARALHAELEEAGVDTIKHIIGDKSESPEEAAVRRLSTTPRDALLQVTAAHVRSDNENTIYLDLELMLIEFHRHNSGGGVATLQEGLAKRYPLHAPDEDDLGQVPISGIAGSFVRDLQAHGLVKTGPAPKRMLSDKIDLQAQGRFNQDSLPSKTRKSSAGGNKSLPAADRARHHIRQTLSLQRQ